MNILETKELSKTFKTRRGNVDAVQGVSINVKEGEIFGFLGPNGAGKTTTMKILSTLLLQTSGSAIINGYDLKTQPQKIRQSIGYVGQSGGVDTTATAKENLYLQARLYGLDKSLSKERVEHFVVKFQMETFADRLGKSYSGGQKRRLDLALGMIHHPKLLFLDEPTTGLDPQSRAYLWEEIRKLRDIGTSIFLTTHYLEEADALCDRLAIIDGGKIVSEGTPLDLKREIAGDIIKLGFQNNAEFDKAKSTLEKENFVKDLQIIDKELYLYVDKGEEILQQIVRILDASAIRIQTISMTRPSLEDVFLRKTGHALRDSNN